MKRLMWILSIACVFGTTTMASDIAFYVGSPNFDGWYSVAEMNKNVATIIDMTGRLFYDVQQFNDDQLAALGEWVEENTDDGEMDILWLNGCVPSSLYPIGNTQPDGSRIENWLDGGNMIINVGDWFAYVTYEGGARSGTENTGTGAANILDLSSGIIVSADNTALTVTDAGKQYIPSLGDSVVTYRPIAPSAVVAPWEVAAVFAQNAAGTYADPIVIHNTVTNSYVAFVNQSSGGAPPGWLNDRGVSCAEFITNWVATVVGLSNPGAARAPVPDDDTVDVPVDVILTWMPSEVAATHDVYFGTSFDDVNDATQPLASVTDTAFDPEGLLEYGQTYYWRIDEVTDAPDYTVVKGNVWSFTAEAYGYQIANVTATASAQQPASPASKTVDRSGLDEFDQHGVDLKTMWATPGGLPAWIQYTFEKVYKLHELWVWNSNSELESIMGFGAKDVVIEYSLDGETWTALENVPEFAQGTGKTTYTANTIVDLGEVLAKHVRLTVNDNWGTMSPIVSLSEVRFFYTPTQAFGANPADGATDVSIDATLNWRPGREATSHELYFGADANAVAEGTVAPTTLVDHSYAPAGLMLATDYFWKVDEVGDAGTYEGDVWTFKTEEVVVIDDFESYGDDMDAEEAVFQTWIDGYDEDTNGSIVGIDPAIDGTFCESTIVHSGGRSMPIFYDNSGAATYAEAKRTFDDGQDWSASGIQSLSLWFRGTIGNTGTLYIKINNTKVTYSGSATDIGIGGWQRWNIVLADTGANLSNVTTLTLGVGGAGAKGTLYVDDIRLYPKVFASPTSNVGIAISTQAGWFGQAAANREMQEIVDNAQAPVVVFNASDQDGLADWLSNHTHNGVANLLILCGQLPDTIYAPGNTQVDDSIVEQFLDGGNTIINTGDWIFYVVNGAGTNGAAGLQTIMDIPGVTVAGGDNTAVTVTADGQELTPSLQDFATDRPFHLDTLAGDWSTELVLAQNATGTLADPVVVKNSATGGRIGVFYQTAGQDNDPRGEVISEWINNWYLEAVSGGN